MASSNHKTDPPPRRPIVSDLQAMKQATNIDRRQCHRVVPMKVLCLGLSRTGTASLRQALLDLQYSDVYHYASIHNENPRDAEMWNEALDAKFQGVGKAYGKAEFDQLLGHRMAVTDTPCAIFYKELLAAYPDAKVILTVRDSAEQWRESHMKTIVQSILSLEGPIEQSWVGRFMGLFVPKEGLRELFARKVVFNYDMYKVLLKDYKEGTKESCKWYEEYVEEVKRLVPEERLLVMNVREGYKCWTPLCKFLDKDVPHWDFPQVNSTQEFQHNADVYAQHFGQLVMANMVKALVPVLAIGIGGLAWWMRYR